MKKIITISIFIFFMAFFGFLLPCFGQFKAEELAELPKWEEYLANARIIGQEQLVGRESMTSPWKLTLELDGVVKNALWKNREGRLKGYIEGWSPDVRGPAADLLWPLFPPSGGERLFSPIRLNIGKEARLIFFTNKDL